MQSLSKRSIKLWINNDSWYETLISLHVSSCKMLHFVISYMKQNKKKLNKLLRNMCSTGWNSSLITGSVRKFLTLNSNIQTNKITYLYSLLSMINHFLFVFTLNEIKLTCPVSDFRIMFADLHLLWVIFLWRGKRAQGMRATATAD